MVLTLPKQQLELVRDQIAVEGHRVALTNGLKGFEKGLIIALPQENLLPVIVTGHHMIEQSLVNRPGLTPTPTRICFQWTHRIELDEHLHKNT
jgi:hypothetical protein